MKGFPDLPPIWWASSIAGIYLGRWLFPGLHYESGFLEGLSVAVLIGALAIIAWSAVWFWKKRTPIEPYHTPKSLIVEGPYRLSRNPIYLALVMLTLASAFGNGSIIGIVLAVILWRIFDRRFAAVEEAMLVETFGDGARDYIARSRRWI